MAVFFDINEVVRRSDFGVLQDAIKLTLLKKAEPFQIKSLIPLYFITKSTKHFEEKFASGGRTMGEFALSDDVSVAPIDDDGEGFQKSFGSVTWMKGFAVSQTALEDMDTNKIQDDTSQLVAGYYRGREYFVRNMIAGGLSGVYNYTRPNGAIHAFDCTTLDSVDGALNTLYKVPLFSVAHRLPENNLKSASGASVVQGNKYCALGGISPTDILVHEKIKDFLGQIRAKGMQFVGEDGKTSGIKYDTIVVPTYYRLKNAIMESVADDSSWTVVEDEYLDGHIGFTEPDLGFLVISKSALSDTQGAVILDRVPLTIRSYIDNDTQSNHWSGRARYGAGFISYRHIAYCTLKNTGLVTTTGTYTIRGQTVADIAAICDRGGTALKGNSLATAIGNVASELELDNCYYGLTIVANAKPVAVVGTVETHPAA